MSRVLHSDFMLNTISTLRAFDMEFIRYRKNRNKVVAWDMVQKTLEPKGIKHNRSGYLLPWIQKTHRYKWSVVCERRNTNKFRLIRKRMGLCHWLIDDRIIFFGSRESNQLIWSYFESNNSIRKFSTLCLDLCSFKAGFTLKYWKFFRSVELCILRCIKWRTFPVRRKAKSFNYKVKTCTVPYPQIVVYHSSICVPNAVSTDIKR